MSTHTTMLHVRVDGEIKSKAAKCLDSVGLSLSDAVRILLTRIANDGGLPVGLIASGADYDAWFKAKVHEALADDSPELSHEEVMANMQDLIDRKSMNA